MRVRRDAGVNAAVQTFKSSGLSVEAVQFAGSIPGTIGLRSGLYPYRFDSETVRSSGCTLTVVGRNE
jgi:hypothetical protein